MLRRAATMLGAALALLGAAAGTAAADNTVSLQSGVMTVSVADAGILLRAGFQNSTRPAAHARPLSLWRLADASATTARPAYSESSDGRPAESGEGHGTRS